MTFKRNELPRRSWCLNSALPSVIQRDRKADRKILLERVFHDEDLDEMIKKMRGR